MSKLPNPWIDYHSATSQAETAAAVPATPRPEAAAVPIASSDGGMKELPASIPDYNGVKSPALVTAHGLSGKSCPLSQSETGPSEAFPSSSALDPIVTCRIMSQVEAQRYELTCLKTVGATVSARCADIQPSPALGHGSQPPGRSELISSAPGAGDPVVTSQTPCADDVMAGQIQSSGADDPKVTPFNDIVAGMIAQLYREDSETGGDWHETGFKPDMSAIADALDMPAFLADPSAEFLAAIQ